MSTPETLFETSTSVPARTRLAARVTVAAALALARLSPAHIRRVLAVVRGRARPSRYDQAQGARQAVVAVSMICAGQGCLARSIATALLCRLGGHWPVWRVGARTSPFGAHAWVEAEGRPVEEGDNITGFRPLMTVGPRPDARVSRIR
ncbi:MULTISPECIES: lasso peptide biosynthesis B2 protein [unclassified Streptomyces]|uniref:lasso peptide biosynthesis B2 protein n=1 Tax=Streptomyces TaxID=1883 RepID=UPI000823F618|nr:MULTISPECIES: lasso peptide biosynthesis B2 protein [unclassified Streptomyces]AWN26450.1 lasso peptide biosynthesis B2 protein [Streptomyces sp. NEAU-S7GS2]MYT13957.1 lasso peptide biosynthesis B2 protein [Streptomyces sp. SID4951]SCK56442.1 Transglutaminase-like superfamily protein [Streptomyces sp. SceaMP-e96]